MVSAALLLLTVSTLAAYIIAVPTKGIPDKLVADNGCEGKTLCDIKPKDYPQEEVDRFVAQNLHHLHRMKRQADPRLEIGSTNNCVKDTKPTKFYRISSSNGLSEAVIQSKFFHQSVNVTTCYDDGGACFADITSITGTRYACKPVHTNVSLFVFTKKGKETRTYKLTTDCICGE